MQHRYKYILFMKSIITFSLFLFFSTSLFSQTFRGQVIDKQTKEAIQFAQIYFIDLKTGTITDENGLFNMENIKQKSIHIVIYGI